MSETLIPTMRLRYWTDSIYKPPVLQQWFDRPSGPGFWKVIPTFYEVPPTTDKED